MIKLNKYNLQAAHYEPPFAIRKDKAKVEASDTSQQIVEKLLWVPAALVARFVHQFPNLYSEADELFAEGVSTLSILAHREDLTAEQKSTFAYRRCLRAMENYANGTESVIAVSVETRYRWRKSGRQVPKSVPIDDAGLMDDHTDILLRDAAEHLGVDLNNMSEKDQRALERLLK